jgi:hypothetical protein
MGEGEHRMTTITGWTHLRTAVSIAALMCLSGCMAADVYGTTPAGSRVQIRFYPGAPTLDDLMIIGGVNYFGTAQYDYDDPIGDIGFRLLSGERVQAECAQVGRDTIGQQECRIYSVYRSTFNLIPVGTTFAAPSLF